jgi:predicted nuclease with TOPRIM domain
VDQVVAGVAEHLVDAAATVDVVVATAADQVGRRAAEDLVAALTTIDHGGTRPLWMM